MIQNTETFCDFYAWLDDVNRESPEIKLFRFTRVVFGVNASPLIAEYSKYWVVKRRQIVKKILSKCVACKKRESRPFEVPPTPQLPEFRLSDDFTFSSIGVDFAGLIYVKDVYNKSSVTNNNNNDNNNSHNNKYILI